MFRTLTFSCLCALAFVSHTPILSADAQSQNQGANSTQPEKPARAKPAVGEVQRKNTYYAKMEDLEQKGFLKIPRGDYSGSLSAKHLLTRYEFAVPLQRMAAGMSIRTLTQDGTKLAFTFGISNGLAEAQAQEILDLWTEFQPELKQLGVESGTFNHIRKTLEIYVGAAPPNRAGVSERLSKGNPVLPYPFSGVETLRVPINGTSSDAMIIDLKVFWEQATPYKDQQKLSRRPSVDYIQYVLDRVNTPVPKTDPK